MVPQRNYKRIISRSILYSLCFGSILLAFPKKGGEVITENKQWFYSAPKKIAFGLPIQVEWGEGGPNIPTTTGIIVSDTTGTTTIPSDTTPPTPVKKLTCADVQLCDKVHFGIGYSIKEKTQYYNAILEIVSSLSQMLPSSTGLQTSLYSLSLSKDGDERRGRGGSRTIAIYTQDINSLQEFREILTHELGHIIDLGVVRGSSSQLNDIFTLGGVATFAVNDPSLDFYRISWDNTSTKKAEAGYTDFVGGYAMTSPFEDFAECFNLFIWHQDTFRAMAEGSEALQKKYNYISRLIKGYYIGADPQGASTIAVNTKWRPWDTTRMSLE